MEKIDYQQLYEAERSKRLAIEADIKTVLKTFTPIVSKMTDSKGNISEMRALTAVPALIMDQGFKNSIGGLMPTLMKYKYLVE